MVKLNYKKSCKTNWLQTWTASFTNFILSSKATFFVQSVSALHIFLLICGHTRIWTGQKSPQASPLESPPSSCGRWWCSSSFLILYDLPVPARPWTHWCKPKHKKTDIIVSINLESSLIIMTTLLNLFSEKLSSTGSISMSKSSRKRRATNQIGNWTTGRVWRNVWFNVLPYH